MVTSPSGWTALTASVRGSQHERDGRPNQDAVLAVELSTARGPAIVAAVADGHGGERYVRSATGARIAVEVSVAAAAAVLARPRWSAMQLAAELGGEVVAEWRRRVSADLATRPLTAAEWAKLGSVQGGDPVVAYGATTLLSVATSSELTLLQLGDGDIVVGRASVPACTPISGDDRLVGGQTTSLCLDTAAADFRSAIVAVDEGPMLVLLASDGYGNSFADADWHRVVVADFAKALIRDGTDAVAAELPHWLEASARAGGDDVTVAVLWRDDAPSSAASRPIPTKRTFSARGLVGSVLAASLVTAAAGFAGGSLSSASSNSGPGTTVASSTDTAPPRTTPETTPSAPADTTATTVRPRDAVSVVGPTGAVITFTPDPARPDAVAYEAAAPVPPHTRVERVVLNDQVWVLQGESLTVRVTGGNARPVDIGAIVPATVVVAGAYVWVLDADETTLVAIDPSTLAAVGKPTSVVRIRPSSTGGGPTVVGAANPVGGG